MKMKNFPTFHLSNKLKRLLHIHLLLKIIMQENFFFTQLMQVPIINCCQRDQAKPLAIRQAFRWATNPFALNFIILINFQPIAFLTTSKLVKFQVPLQANTFFSFIIAYSQPKLDKLLRQILAHIQSQQKQQRQIKGRRTYCQ